ncbi:Alpha-aminoadipate--LysW ligase LysX [Zhongshania aliphaticivorans]|uniref:Alpha-aminoadipate--LysW ligase LysX n=1 Tax=Zhongshania aliphaticivorans TaxID=1470434 RepID=A0A5S9MNL9_9GAMM|nr:RimK family protein [Zhongshania aliphaticivorans]CAA0078248.1 Alpha-aminoadipate--LysW ligase LysX [Zhongshania aliphaticivorans]CAA0086774.1 Alpha-aminoadipate--LysW ligase LysX [Zhongshania aliphaticivorans]
MSRFFVVVDDIKDWSPYYPSQDVITFDDYLERISQGSGERVRVINLCRSYRYLGTGYYCSLLAEARSHNVLPSVSTLSELARKSLSDILLEGVEPQLAKLAAASTELNTVVRCWFGECLDAKYSAIAKAVFERFPAPLLEISLEYKQRWQIKKVQILALKSLKPGLEQEAFASTFERFSSKMWRKPKARKSFRYDLAILVDPEEALPPSNKAALRKFIKAAGSVGISAELITKKDYLRLPEYDGLFIRETTAVDHHTYRFAKKATAEGLVVMDDPSSILRCTNKIYLADLLASHKVPTPRTEFLRRDKPEELERIATTLGYPIVLKVPDGAFSRGVVKVEDWQSLGSESQRLLDKSALLLAQEFMFTDYDWRIGVLDGKPLFACRYYMVRNHWQIYKHGNNKSQSGGFDTMPTYEVPKKVLDVAIKACKLIGDGFYGVDVKQSDGRVVVIEVNDNPSIDSGVEDLFLGDGLYDSVMEVFLRRMAQRRR